MKKAIFPTLLATLLCAACQESFDKRLQREAKEYTEKHCPAEPEAGTRLDSVTYSPAAREYALCYTLSADNERVLRANSALMRHTLRESLAANVDYKELKKRGVTFRFVYCSAETGRTVYDTRFTRADYQ